MAYASTVHDAFANLKTRLETLVGVAPSGNASALRDVLISQGTPSQGQIPFLAMQITSFKPVSVLDGNREWEVTIKLRVVYNISGAEAAQDDALHHIEQIEDCLEGWLRPDGVEGGENALWALTVPTDPSAGSLAIVESELALHVVAARSGAK